MKIVSFYSDIDNSNYYKNHSLRLKKMCDELDIPHLIVERNYGDKWIDNVRAKPLFLKEVLEALNEDFIWLDIDSNVLTSINKLNINSDWMVDMRNNNTPHDYIYIIKNIESNKMFIEEWIKTIDKRNRGSHTAFIEIYSKLNYSIIPPGYFSIGELSKVEDKKKYFKYEK